jgi:hypothetical protein
MQYNVICLKTKELGRKLTDDEVAATLQLWGHPRQVAATYVPPTPLVSSELMPVYKQTLIYVFGLIFLLQCLGSSIHFLQTDYFKTLQFLMQLLFGFFDSAATAFMVVTLIALVVLTIAGCCRNNGGCRIYRRSAGPGNK